MPLTNAGTTHFAQDVIAEAVTAFDNTNAHLGVGDSATAFAKAQTDLQAGANKFRRPMVATFPQRSGVVLTFEALFATGEANFTWAEWGLFNALAVNTMLCRKVEALGTKTSAQTWRLNVDITINNP